MDIDHRESEGRFVVPLPSGEAFLRYERRAGVLDFVSVFVPPAHRGQGYPEQILKAAFAFARAQGLKVIPTCPYISGVYVPRHPEIADMLAAGQAPRPGGPSAPRGT